MWTTHKPSFMYNQCDTEDIASWHLRITLHILDLSPAVSAIDKIQTE